MSVLTAGDIIEQLTMIFQSQKAYLSSEEVFEDILPWQQLLEQWDQWNLKLEDSMKQSNLSEGERLSITLLVKDHHDLSDYVEVELAKLGQKINEMQHIKRARNNYEHTNDVSIFYDEKK